MKINNWLILLCVGYAGWAHADIYKYVDAEGRVTYTSTKIKGAKKLNLPSAYTSSSTPTSARGDTDAGDFPRVDSKTQKSRDESRRAILEEELAAEDELLMEARKNLQAAEENPEVFRGKDGKIYRNVAKFQEKTKPLQEQVSLHELNIEALKLELSKLK